MPQSLPQKWYRVTLLADNCHLEGILGCRHFIGDGRCLRQYHSLPWAIHKQGINRRTVQWFGFLVLFKVTLKVSSQLSYHGVSCVSIVVHHCLLIPLDPCPPPTQDHTWTSFLVITVSICFLRNSVLKTIYWVLHQAYVTSPDYYHYIDIGHLNLSMRYYSMRIPQQRCYQATALLFEASNFWIIFGNGPIPFLALLFQLNRSLWSHVILNHISC